MKPSRKQTLSVGISLILAVCIFPVNIVSSLSVRNNVEENKTTKRTPAAMTIPERRRKVFKRGHDLLANKAVPFDPDVLLDRDWKTQLKPIFDSMPELQSVRHADAHIKGTQFAHTLYLPERVDLDGDTVILVRRLVLTSRNVTIKGNYAVSIFALEGAQLFETDARAQTQTRTSKAGFLVPGAGAETNATGRSPIPHITIDTSGLSSEEWLQRQSVEIARWAGPRKLNNHSLKTIIFDGTPGANGTNGTPGTAGMNGGAGSNGSAGSCTGSMNGGDGVAGENGDSEDFGPGTGGDGGTGQNGGAGNGGTPIVVNDLNVSMSYISNGGPGGNGGAGGKGGAGGNGGKGGNGGIGASCNCNFGNGGNGGNGGHGFPGGNGGNGGNGGTGGPGGDISVTYRPGYEPSTSNH